MGTVTLATELRNQLRALESLMAKSGLLDLNSFMNQQVDEIADRIDAMAFSEGS